MKISGSVLRQWRDLDRAAVLNVTTRLRPDAALDAMVDKFQKQPVQLGHHAGVLLTERAATVDQQP
ncbi:hypothetical protein [uncultured Jatrophihabitans sp.]|uniref:hypothetical protein n=1 Tax=uncultured Jatrophihabitans sp. TaxID=1610747 RepID=UPI0035CB67A5